ncbi:hypothetical protein GCM10010145_22910 [Streptomyces ruber]|uniref:Uncharacterized protein n=3 Tax=Streptomyces TaxID=1883 RepID=A0A918BAN4_9ACTN|nr:hypothetical protein GCM10010145_22910 [Streptomyces ruber]
MPSLGALPLVRPDTFTPDTCTRGPADWNPIASAGAMSAFCGVFAGFVFAGIVVVIGQKNPPGGDGHASRGLRLLLPSFFGLATASYLYALVAGEMVCLRSWTGQLLSGAILAADAVVVIAALAWLLPAYQRAGHHEIRFFRQLVHFTAQFSALMVTVASLGFNNAMLRRQAAPWSDALMWGSGVAVMATLTCCWLRPPPPYPPTGPRPAPPPARWRDETVLDRRVGHCAWTTLAVSGALAVGAGVLGGVPHEHWARMPRWLVYGLGEACLLLPGAVLATALRALPRP